MIEMTDDELIEAALKTDTKAAAKMLWQEVKELRTRLDKVEAELKQEQAR